MNRSKISRGLAAAGLMGLAALAGCATTVPSDLAQARATYNRVAAGPARENARSYLMTARKALDRAEESFENSGASADTHDFAYIAERLAQVAEAQAGLSSAIAQRNQLQESLEMARARVQQQQQQQLAGAQNQLGTTAQQLEAERRARMEAEQRAQEQQQALMQERQRAEQLAQEAQRAQQQASQSDQQTKEALSRLGQVREEARGTVLSLSGSVLFTSGKSNLIPSSQRRLLGLADALKTMQGDQRITIEGYTDSTGSRELNQRLSERRAQSVKDFLVEHGIQENRIDVVGRGPDNPVADNGTAEGRANNRRVEVVLSRPVS